MAAHQAPPSLGFSRQEYWSGLPFPSLGDLPKPRIKLTSPLSPELQLDPLPTEPTLHNAPLHCDLEEINLFFLWKAWHHLSNKYIPFPILCAKQKPKIYHFWFCRSFHILSTPKKTNNKSTKIKRPKTAINKTKEIIKNQRDQNLLVEKTCNN